jgi:hypothetical protein
MAYDGPSVVDFSQLRRSPFAHALDPLVAAVDDIVTRRHQSKMQEERLAQEENHFKLVHQHQLAQDSSANARIAQADRRQVGQATAENAKSRAEVEGRIRDAVSTGRPDLARSIAASYAEADPATGTVAKGLPGFSIKQPDPGHRPEAPDAPRPIPYGPQATPDIISAAAQIRGHEDAGAEVVPEDAAIQAGRAEGQRFAGARGRGEEEGPVPTQDETDRALLDRREPAFYEAPALPDDSGPQEESRQFNAAQDPGRAPAQFGNQLVPAQYLETVAQHDHDIGMWRDRAAAPPEVTVGGVPFDPKEARRATIAGRKENAADVGKAFAGTDQKYVDLVTALAASGVPPEKLAPIASAQMEKDNARAFREQQDRMYKPDVATAEGGKNLRARIAADSRVRAAGTARPEAAPANGEAISPRVLPAINSHIANLEKEYGLHTTRSDLEKTRLVLDNQKDPVAQRSMAYNVLARGLAGEKGPLSKDDVTRLSGHLQGVFGDVGNWFSTHLYGDMSDAQLKTVLPMVKEVLRAKTQDMAAAEQAYQDGLVDNPSYRAMGPGVQNHILARKKELFGHDSKDTSSKATAPAGSDPQVDEILKALQE